MITVEKINNSFFRVKKDGYDVFKGKTDGYFLYNDIVKRSIFILDNASQIKYEIPLSQTSYNGLNNAMLQIADQIFIEYDTGAVLPSIENISSVASYFVVKKVNSILIIGKKNIFDIKQRNIKNNSNISIDFINDFNFKYSLIIVRSDNTRIQNELENLYTKPFDDSDYLSTSGGALGGNLSMSNFKVTNLGNGTNPTDAVNLNQLIEYIQNAEYDNYGLNYIFGTQQHNTF